MAPRPLLLLPVLALLAGTAACGGAPAVTAAGAAPTTSPTSARTTSRAHPRPVATTTRTVTVTVTRTTSPRPAPSTTTASFTPFVGEWVGHTRHVVVSKSGRLEEHVGDGCCHPIIDLVLQLSNPHKVGGSWVATSRVVSANVHDGWKDYGQPAPKPGDRGTVTIGTDHIMVESISSNGFCDPDRTAPGTCGA